MRPKDLYFTLGMNKELYSKIEAPVDESEPYYDSIRYIKVDSTAKASMMIYTIDKFMRHKSPLVRKRMRTMVSGTIVYLRYHENNDKLEKTSSELIKANGYAGCACSPDYFFEEIGKRRSDESITNKKELPQ